MDVPRELGPAPARPPPWCRLRPFFAGSIIGMAPGLPRARFNSSTLVRTLAEMAVAEVADSEQTLGERLGLWLGWADAISLSAVLNGGIAARPAQARRRAASLGPQVARVRSGLALAIATDDALQAQPNHQVRDGGADFSPYRRCYLAHQGAMDAGIRPLRAQLRAELAGRSAALAQLAALDAVMDDALVERERHVLAGVPRLLEQRHRRLHQGPGDVGLALARFGQDVQDVLLAELELRWQPIEGMMEALSHEDNRHS